MRAIGLSLLYAHAANRFAVQPRMSVDRFKPLVQELADGGATRGECEEAFASALKAVYEPKPLPPPPPISNSGELKQPSTPSDGQRAFREHWTGKLVTQTMKKFVDRIIEDRCTILRFQYSPVYALGLTALCDVFLPVTCIDESDADAARATLCFSLGLDAATVAADAAALQAAASGATREELLASEDLAAIKAATFKYSYAFGVGLVLLMRACGDTQVMSTGKGYASREQVGGGAIVEWCAALELNYANTLERDTARPLEIEGVGSFDFDIGLKVPKNLDGPPKALGA